MKRKQLFALSIIFFIGFFLNFKYFNEFPKFIHAWAQADRYALAIGFTENGLNFFKPKTFVINHQFPGNSVIESESITSVDFPVHDYIPAVIMKLLNNNCPCIFRIYIFLYSIIGLFFLFKLAYLLTKHFFFALLLVVFAATSPIFVYYQAGFLPTIPSLSNAIIGTYFYLVFIKTNKSMHFFLSVLFFTLAALSRTTFVIYIIAFVILELLRIIQKRVAFDKKYLLLVASISIISFYYFYNMYLKNQYGSIFLNKLMMPNSVGEIKYIIVETYNNWRFQYFSSWHYYLFILIIVIAIFSAVMNKNIIDTYKIYFVFFIALVFLGFSFFALVMLKQFIHHDYYFLDTFFLPTLLLLCFLLILISKLNFKYIKLCSIVVFVFFVFFTSIRAHQSQTERRITGEWDRTSKTVDNFTGSEKILDSLNIPKNAKILVLDAYAPNIPLILLNREGYSIITTSAENIEKALNWKFDYIVIQNEFFISDVYRNYPQIINLMEKIYDNGMISICKLLPKPINRSLPQFLGLTKNKIIFEQRLDFETNPDTYWQNVIIDSSHAFSGKKAALLSDAMEFGITYKTKDLKTFSNQSHQLFFSSQIYKCIEKDCELVVSIYDNEKSIFYQSFNINSLIQTTEQWQNVAVFFTIPKIAENNYEFAFYFWNTGKTHLFCDDIILIIY